MRDRHNRLNLVHRARWPSPKFDARILASCDEPILGWHGMYQYVKSYSTKQDMRMYLSAWAQPGPYKSPLRVLWATRKGVRK